jgi:hypothetical protein
MQKWTFVPVIQGLKKAGGIYREKGKAALKSSPFWANLALALLNVGCLMAYEPACRVVEPVRAAFGL